MKENSTVLEEMREGSNMLEETKESNIEERKAEYDTLGVITSDW